MFETPFWQRLGRAGGPALGVFVTMLIAIGVCVGFPCIPLGLSYGIWTDRCPSGELRLDVEANAYGLVRGEDDGQLIVQPAARWLVGADRWAVQLGQPLHRGVRVSAELLDRDEAVVASLPRGAFRRSGPRRIADVALPDLADGDYTLRVTSDAGFETAIVDLPVPLYTPALVHIMTDRPLYKPGQLVQFRAAVLRRTDRAPLENRPGRWEVTTPSGQAMLVEKGATGPWGIVAGDFPLDREAEVGTWTVTWTTGDDQQSASFDVRPFALPRLGVDVAAATSWAGHGDPLTFEGRATYTSGAPVARAAVRARLSRVEGRWPMPIAWEDERTLRTDADGRFAVEIGRVPADLMAPTTLALDVAVVDEAGETARGRAPVVLSPQSLRLDAVTELGDGVVGGFNNRVYLRVATPDGTPLAGARVEVRPPNDPDDVWTGTADASGVIAMQLDPGDPITVIDPAPPVRRRPLEPKPPELITVALSGGGLVDLATRRVLDEAIPDLSTCGIHTVGDATVEAGLRLDRRGRVVQVMTPPGSLGACVARALVDLGFPRGEVRTLALRWRIADSQHPYFELRHAAAFGSGAPEVVPQAALDARRCLPFGRGEDGASVYRVHWAVGVDQRAVRSVIEPLDTAGLPRSTRACVARALRSLTLTDPSPSDRMGTTTVVLRVPSADEGPPPEALTRTAYALRVAAFVADDPTPRGEGRLVLPVGVVPDVRLRATPSLVAPGDSVTVEVLRGPDFVGTLPRRLRLMQGTVEIDEVEVEDNRAVFTVPDDVSGFLSTLWGGGRAVVFVRPADPLVVTVTSDRTTYRPGDEATLTVTTTADGQPEPAGVGLSGVDATLARLAALPGPQDLGRATVRAQSTTPAFGVFDPVGLALGQVAGENAAMATVLRVGTLPADAAGDRPVATRESVAADVETPLTLGFYRALEDAAQRVRAWEATAPESELLTPARMVGFWQATLAELEAAGAPALDGFGRTLVLDVLPEPLLAQLDPRRMATEGTRLPEDVVNWFAYVQDEGRPR